MDEADSYMTPMKALVQNKKGVKPIPSSVYAPIYNPICGGLVFSATMCRILPTIRPNNTSPRSVDLGSTLEGY